MFITQRQAMLVVHAQRIRLVISDVAGIADFDAQVAGSLISLTRSLRLIGTRVIMTGISSTLARTLARQELNVEELKVVSSPQEALSFAQPAITTLSPD